MTFINSIDFKLKSFFNRVGNLTEDKPDSHEKSDANVFNQARNNKERSTGMSLLLMQLKGLLMKRIIYTKRRSFLYGLTVSITLTNCFDHKFWKVLNFLGLPANSYGIDLPSNDQYLLNSSWEQSTLGNGPFNVQETFDILPIRLCWWIFGKYFYGKL